jgi:predicted Zn-dependent peptidase
MPKKFQKKILENGMTILFEKRDIPVVSIAIAIKHGGIHEAEHEKGISHFIEHMLYKGTPTRNSKKIATEIEKNGGELNGFTSEEVTAYWCKMPSIHADIALDVLTDMVKNPIFDEKELEKERKVIFEEMNMRKDSPRVFIFDEIQDYLYKSPLGKNLIGTKESLNKIDRKSIIRKFKDVYTPNNMILCVVGNYKMEEIIDWAEKNFKKEEKQIPQIKVQKTNKSKIIKRKGIDQANMVIAFHLPLAKDKKNYAAQVLMTLMGEGMSSRLFTEIREKKNLAYAIKADVSINRDFSYGIVYAGTTPEKVEICKKLILKEFEEVSKNLTEKELEQTKNQMIGNYLISMEDSQVQLGSLLTAEIENSAEEFYKFEKMIKKVKLENVKKLAKIKKYSFLALVPEN